MTKPLQKMYNGYHFVILCLCELKSIVNCGQNLELVLFFRRPFSTRSGSEFADTGRGLIAQKPAALGTISSGQ